MRLHRPHPAQPRRPARGGRMGGKRRSDLGLFQLIDLQRQPDGRRGDDRHLLADIGLEALRPRIVARRRGREEGVGAQAAHDVGRLFIQGDGLIQRRAQSRRVAPLADQLALEGVHPVHQGLGAVEVGADARILARGVEVGQVPQRGVGQVGGLDGGVHGQVVGKRTGGRKRHPPSFSPCGRRKRVRPPRVSAGGGGLGGAPELRPETDE
ncbi:hypothetical protein D3C71_1434970 [compost metagenome]